MRTIFYVTLCFIMTMGKIENYEKSQNA